MCGIIGIFNHKNAFNQIKKGLKKIEFRGKDGVGICSDSKSSYADSINKLKDINSKNIIGHNLHSIVGHVSQPIKSKKTLLAANCEIYNWKQLKKKYSLKSKNDAQVILDIIEKTGAEDLKNIKKILLELDGVYAFSFWDKEKNKLFLARDIIGVKPLWYAIDIFMGQFAFASEKKALEEMGYKSIEELNPRYIAIYDLKTRKLKKIKREFFKTGRHKSSKEQIIKKTQKLLLNALEKRLPNQKFGILFSGGIDSTFLAYLCKKLDRDFICYTAALEEEGMQKAQDLIYAEKIAKELGLKLKVKKLNLDQTSKLVKKVTPLIEDNNVVKVGVALTFYAACELAKKDGIKVIFSGLGSEEIFAGYDRHKKSYDINWECLSGLIKMYERDLYRDDVITMHNQLELRLPFLDKQLVKYALKIPQELKLDDKQSKIILRDIAKKEGLKDDYSQRKKKAAQYGSKFHKALQKLAKNDGRKLVSDYLYQFYHPPNVKLGVLWSTGKDSAYAAWTMQKQNYELSCLISIVSKNEDSYMFHTPNINLADLHAISMNMPIIIQETKGQKEKELLDMKKAIKKAKDNFKIEGVVTGALYSNYQRQRIEKICDELELKIFNPLWHIDQENEMRALINEGFEIIFSSVAAYGLDKNWLGRTITHKDIDKLVHLEKKIGLNVAGEGGEFESLVIDAPFFDKKLKVVKSHSYMDEDGQGRFIIKDAKLITKKTS